MYCPFCGCNVNFETAFCSSCGKNIKFVHSVNKPGTSEDGKAKSALALFQEFRSSKEKERRSCFKKKKEPLKESRVKISVGLMRIVDGVLKPVRGMVLPLVVQPGADAKQLLNAAEQKMKDFNKNLKGTHYLLLYPDGSEILNIPGTETPFSLKNFKEAVGKAYQRITVYICTAEDFHTNSKQFHSDSSDSEVIITSRSAAEFNLADTAKFEPILSSTCDGVGESAHVDSALPILLSDSEEGPGTSRGTMDKTRSFWADYLLDCEENDSAVTLEEVFMFATGVPCMPPAGMEPPPRLQFLFSSKLPMANTCTNTLKLPLLDRYDTFKVNMNFGIKNSPGFGCT